MLVWVTRDKLDHEKCCGLFFGNTKPKFFEVTLAYTVSDFDMTLKKFVRRFKIAPEKGSCQQYELTLTKI